jgi:hypothetical protein
LVTFVTGLRVEADAFARVPFWGRKLPEEGFAEASESNGAKRRLQASAAGDRP